MIKVHSPILVITTKMINLKQKIEWNKYMHTKHIPPKHYVKNILYAFNIFKNSAVDLLLIAICSSMAMTPLR